MTTEDPHCCETDEGMTLANDDVWPIHTHYCDDLAKEREDHYQSMLADNPNMPSLDHLVYLRAMFNCELYVQPDDDDGSVRQLFFAKSANMNLAGIEKMLLDYFLCPGCIKKPVIRVDLKTPEAWIITVVDTIPHEDGVEHGH